MNTIRISGIHSASTSWAPVAIILDVQPVLFRHVLRRSCPQCSRPPVIRQGATFDVAHPRGYLYSRRPMRTAGPGFAPGVRTQSAPHLQIRPFTALRRESGWNGDAGLGHIGHRIHRRSGLSSGLALQTARGNVCHSLDQLRSIISGRIDLNREGGAGVSRLLRVPLGLMLGTGYE